MRLLQLLKDMTTKKKIDPKEGLIEGNKIMIEKEEMMPPEYVDFVPDCTWSRENDRETLVLHLPGFSREQVSILIDTRRQLKIKGERQMKERNRRSRFSKDFAAPKHCDLKGVRAHFDRDAELLSVTMPRPPPAASQLNFKIYVLVHYKLGKAWERLFGAASSASSRTDVVGGANMHGGDASTM